MNGDARRAYRYSVLRYVHDIATGEFINVGIVVVAPAASFVGGKFRLAYGRVKRTFPSIDAQAFKTRMRHLQAAFDRLAEGDIGDQNRGNGLTIDDVINAVVRVDDSSWQWSPVGSGLSRDLNATLLALYHRFVTKYDQDQHALRKDDDVWKCFRSALERRNVLPLLEEKVIAVADDSVTFEHAWKNGMWHCYEPLSFDLASDASIKEKAHRWLGQVSSIKDAEDRFAVYFLVGRPVDDSLNGAYEKALSILRKAPSARVVEEARADEFSDEVARVMSAKQSPI